MNAQTAFGWSWKRVVGGRAVVAKGRMGVQRGMSARQPKQLWAKEGPCGALLGLQKQLPIGVFAGLFSREFQ